MAELLDELIDFLRIPSVSTGGGDEGALAEAAEWLRARIAAAGGAAEVVPTERNPLVVGELRSTREAAPTLLVYGHYDVQDPGPAGAWTTPPFEPDVRDGRIYARGAADDKGNFLPLLHVACALARARELPMHVRFLVDGEEEIGGDSASRWLTADERGADCAVVFDSLMVDERTPALTIGARGIVTRRVRVRTAEHDLHSGLYGGAALNATHALMRMLAAVLPDADGRVREELRAGALEPDASERQGWQRLPGGAEALAAAGAQPLAPDAAESFHERTTAAPALDVNHLAAGAPRTILPAVAEAHVSIRLAQGQSGERVAGALEALLRGAAPPGASVELAGQQADPAAFDPADPVLRAAQEVLRDVCGREPALVRLGGTLPILATLAARSIPTIFTGFVVEEDGYHAPDESFRLEALELGRRTALGLFRALAGLR